MIDRDAEAPEQSAEGLDNTCAFIHDISIPDEVIAMVGAVRKTFGRIDAVVNNAGVADFGPMEEADFILTPALRASTLRVAYGTSKAAVIQLTKQQAVELGEFGIRANCVCPGPVRTKLALL